MTPPKILCVGGHDPAGGAGIQADIETLKAHDCHAMSLVSVSTIQDTTNVIKWMALPTEWLSEQLAVLSQDIRIDLVKISLLGSADQVTLLSDFIQQNRLQLIFDPVLEAGGGTALSDPKIIKALCDKLLPQTTLLTPNHKELALLTGQKTEQAAIAKLYDHGCHQILVTGTDKPSALVEHRLYIAPALAPIKTWQQPRLPFHYHGSGCTLAAAITAGLAYQHPLIEACDRAFAYVLQALEHAYPVGKGQKIPLRICYPTGTMSPP